MSLLLDSPFKQGVNVVIVTGMVEHVTNMPDSRIRLHLLIPDGARGIKIKVIVHECDLQELEKQGVDLNHAFISVRGKLKSLERNREMSLYIVASSVEVVVEAQANSTQPDTRSNGSDTAGRPGRAGRNGKPASRRSSADPLA